MDRDLGNAVTPPLLCVGWNCLGTSCVLWSTSQCWVLHTHVLKCIIGAAGCSEKQWEGRHTERVRHHRIEWRRRCCMFAQLRVDTLRVPNSGRNANLWGRGRLETKTHSISTLFGVIPASLSPNVHVQKCYERPFLDWSVPSPVNGGSDEARAVCRPSQSIPDLLCSVSVPKAAFLGRLGTRSVSALSMPELKRWFCLDEIREKFHKFLNTWLIDLPRACFYSDHPRSTRECLVWYRIRCSQTLHQIIPTLSTLSAGIRRTVRKVHDTLLLQTDQRSKEVLASRTTLCSEHDKKKQFWARNHCGAIFRELKAISLSAWSIHELYPRAYCCGEGWSRTLE